MLSDQSFSYLWHLCFGAVTAETMLDWQLRGRSGLLVTILIANWPHVLLSSLFLIYDCHFTCMLMAEEWSGYVHERRLLRVSNPSGSQRSTYRLQLPYKYGIPLLVLSGLMHWPVSQSPFIARVNLYTRAGTGIEDPTNSISTIGYSCIAIFTVVVLGTVVIIVGLINGFRRYKPGMPLVGSCSAAITAVCHSPSGDEDAAHKPLRRGLVASKRREELEVMSDRDRMITEKGAALNTVMMTLDNYNHDGGHVGHCCFTNLDCRGACRVLSLCRLLRSKQEAAVPTVMKSFEYFEMKLYPLAASLIAV